MVRSILGGGLLAVLLMTTVCGCSRESAPEPSADTARATPAGDANSSADPAAERIRQAVAGVNGERIIGADDEPGNWLSYGRNYQEERYSPLHEVNTGTISDLGLAWYWDTGTTRGLEATPIVVNGIMFTSGAWSVVWAHDAKTGALLWTYDPQVPRAWGKEACCDVVNRGVAVWNSKIYVGTLDGRLVALDAGTGKPVWSVQTTDPDRAYTITGAPRIVKGKVLIGNGGAEYGVRGYVTAYDAETGEQAWRFYTVPGDPSKPFEGKHLEQAAKTWRGGKWWEVGGGGTAWDAMAFDPELNLLYIGVGNGAPWNRYIRSPGGGDNLYLASIVAVDPDDGTMVWYYQTTPGDSWDYTATQHMILADLTIDGVQRKVIMQAPKNGFFYVLDRTNGEFISAEAYVPVNWATRVDPETGRPVENPDTNYANEPRLVRPAPYGGHNWQPMAYNRDTGLVYIPALDIPFSFAQDNAFRYKPMEWNTGIDLKQTIPPKDPDTMVAALSQVKGHLAAWDPVAQKEVWRVDDESSWNGGVLTTAGNLVFQGLSDGKLAAYTADTGKLVWEFPTHVGIVAPPVTYTVDGEQYVSVVAGWGGAFALASGVPRHKDNVLTEGRILTFKLGGKAQLPEPQVAYLEIPEPPAMAATPEQVAKGESLYHTYCAVCHGPGAVSAGGGTPDLRYSSVDVHKAWDAIVRQGAFTGKGMASFSHVLSEDDAKAVEGYVVSQAQASIALCKSKYRQNYPEVVGTACVRPQVSASP